MMGVQIANYLLTLLAKKELIIALTQREIRQRYKQSLLGIGWVIITPIITMLVLSVIFSQFLKIVVPGVPYPIFVYVGLIIWNFFASALSAGTTSLIVNSNLITKTYFPREIVIISTLLAKFFDLCVASIVFALLLVFFRISPSWQYLWLPLVIASLVLFTYALSMLTALINVFFRDMANALTLLLFIGTYITPIMYPFSLIPQKYQFFFALNPLTVIITSLRNVFLFQNPPLPMFFSITLPSIIVLAAGTNWLFKKYEQIIADYL